MKKWGFVSLILAIFLLSNFFISYNVEACKDIVACGDATGGDYNLLLKVRDPSRPGLQVLCIVPEGYEYTYHHPWNGKPMSFTNEHKYIGVASKEDILPNIVKAGMSLSDSGISYGDADTGSRWVNPTKHAWDDFDWLRYTYEKANDEDQATILLTEDAVKKMHATGVSENLFVVGPKKGVVIEADAFRYKIKEIENGIVVMSNYPKELWKSQIIKKLPIARSFDAVVEKYVRNRGAIRLKSLYGIRVVKIDEDSIIVKPISIFHALKTGNLGVVTKIGLSERKTVGYYSVELLDIDGNKAKVRVCFQYKAWEEKMLEYIQPRYGSINVRDMIKWSRLKREDLDGLRPMCEESVENEAVAIYKIPRKKYETLSIGWFSPNHACSSIYVPFHICNNDIYDAYETGEAAQICLDLYKTIDTEMLSSNFTKVEDVFFDDIDSMEKVSADLLMKDIDVSEFLTIIDTSMQKQAFLTEEIWMETNFIYKDQKIQEIRSIIDDIWSQDYMFSLEKMKNAVLDLKEISDSAFYRDKIIEIALDICKSRIEAAETIGKDIQTAEEIYKEGGNLIKQGEFELGFDNLQDSFVISDAIIKGQDINSVKNVDEEKPNEFPLPLIFLIFILIIVIIVLIARLRLNFK